MFNIQRRFSWVWLLLVAGFLIGCTASSTPPGASSIGGVVDGGSYSYHYWEEGLAVLFWQDVSYGSGEGCSGTGSTDDPVYRLECNVSGPEGNSYSWQVHTADGLTAEMWIEDQPIDLSKGAMFLVNVGDDGPQVEQLQRDLSTLERSNEAIAALAQTDPDVASFLVGSDAEDDTADVGDQYGLAELTEALRAAGQSVEIGGQVDQPFFSVPGQVLAVNGQDVQVFEYPDPAAAAGEAAEISPDASSVGTSMMTWVATPHFYARDRIIVLYVGDDESMLDALSRELGQPVAQGQGMSQLPPVQEPPSNDTAVYRNAENGFELDYPASWRLDEQVLGSRASGASFYGEEANEEPVFSAVVYLWDPKNDLDAWVGQRRLSWSGSDATVLLEEALTLADGQRAIQFELQWPDGQTTNHLFMAVGDRYLELVSSGDADTFSAIIGSLRLVDSG